jgi:hypothetical protein
MDPCVIREVFKAAQATSWKRTNLGPRTEVSVGGYHWTVELPASGEGRAYITGREGYGGTEHCHFEATGPETIAIVERARADLRP